jgi:hypothetical protein
MRIIDGSPTNGAVESISNNTIDNPGTGVAGVGLDITIAVQNVGQAAITGNTVRLTRNGTIGIRLNAVANKNASNSTIIGNTVVSTAGTTQTGILVRASGTTAGTTAASHIVINSNVVSGVATGIALNALSTNSAGAAVISHIDEAQVIGNICDTVTTCVSASAVNSGTSVANVASVDHLQISDLQINGATTGIVTSTTAASGAATMTATQIGLISANSVTTQVSLGGTNERAFTHTVTGSVALNGATPVTVTLSGPDVFTSSSSYACTTADLTAASAFTPLLAYSSGTAFTLTGIVANTDTIQYVCVGY